MNSETRNGGKRHGQNRASRRGTSAIVAVTAVTRDKAMDRASVQARECGCSTVRFGVAVWWLNRR